MDFKKEFKGKVVSTHKEQFAGSQKIVVTQHRKNVVSSYKLRDNLKKSQHLWTDGAVRVDFD